MKWYIKRLASFLPAGSQRKLYERYYRKQFEKWQLHKQLPVAHLVKQQTVIQNQRLFKIKTLVETGTYMGDMIYMMEPEFDTLYTIELSKKLHKKAVKRFAGHDNIHLLQGDSGVLIGQVVNELKTPAIFWLDGHYSEGITAKGELNTPIVEELKSIFKSPLPHVVLIDDARLFNGTDDYPTIADVEKLTDQFTTGRYTIKVENDIIQIRPKS